jgi:long-subunit fatty acid transport protein
MVCSAADSSRGPAGKDWSKGLLAFPGRIVWEIGLAASLCVAFSARASAQSPVPPPIQDQLDLQARSDVVQGSGARALGMGGAFLARPDDATAASWNPAGLSYLRRPEVSGVFATSGLTSNQTFPTLNTGVDQRAGSTPDFFSAAYPFEWGRLSGAGQVSFQRVVSFSNHRNFVNPSGATFATTSSGGFDVLAIGTGVHITKRLRVGVTVNHWFNGYVENVDKQVPRSESFQRTDFGISAWNTNAGVIFNPWESLNVGIVGKTLFSGDVALTQTRTDTLPNETLTTCAGSTCAAPTCFVVVVGTKCPAPFTPPAQTLRFPGAVGVGLSWRALSALTISSDYTRTFWSRARIGNFFILPPPTSPEKGKPVPGAPEVFANLPYPTLSDFDQQDTQQIRAGVEYVVVGDRLRWPLRAGAFTDSQYFRAASGAAPRFVGWTAGTGVIMGPVLFDVAYVHETGSYTDQQGIQNSVTSYRVFFSLIYRYAGHR